MAFNRYEASDAAVPEKIAFSLLFFARDHFGPAGRMDTISVSHYLLIGIPNHITTRNIRRIFFHEEKRARRRR
jgi:hypothetical protein